MKKLPVFIGLKVVEISSVSFVFWLSAFITKRISILVYGYDFYENFFVNGLIGILVLVGAILFIILFIALIYWIIVKNIEWAEKISNKFHV